MVPTFLPKRRSGSHSLRVGFIVSGLVCLGIGYSMAIASMLADRVYSRVGKLGIITSLLITALLGLGLLERLKRHWNVTVERLLTTDQARWKRRYGVDRVETPAAMQPGLFIVGAWRISPPCRELSWVNQAAYTFGLEKSFRKTTNYIRHKRPSIHRSSRTINAQPYLTTWSCLR